MYEATYPPPDHHFMLNTAQLSSLPAGRGKHRTESVIEYVPADVRALRPLFVDQKQAEDLARRMRTCRSGECACWSNTLSAAFRHSETDIRDLAGDRPWVTFGPAGVAGGGRKLALAIGQSLPAHGDIEREPITITYDASALDGTVEVGNLKVSFHAVPEHAERLTWWMNEPADLDVVRTVSPETAQVLIGAVLAPDVSSRVRLTDLVAHLAPLVEDEALCRQAASLLTTGWKQPLSDLVEALEHANTPPGGDCSSAPTEHSR